MFVKKLELLGFKTFAEKTEIAFSPGITAVVGPNGCGKSNIADALSWVLGESNVRNIRGQRATDVIFSGTEKRRALGMAEVSLTLDNACGTLPIGYSEVTITRRSFRSGEAEYFINKTRCRLKDIYELFLDTGIGREAYSMVTQGEIDAILSAKPEDRRELFEEAAGVKKYRYRRQEALRKLDKTEANLHRIRDIMAEIGGQLEPLAQQAEEAKTYNELQSRLREIEIGLLIRDLRRYTEALAEARECRKDAGGKIEHYDRLLSDLEWEKDKQNTKLQGLEEEIEDARRVQMSLSGNVQRLEGRAALLDERLRSAQSGRDRTGEEISAFESRIEETRKRINRLEREEAVYAQADQRLRAEAEAKSAGLAELDRRYGEVSRSVSDQKASYLELAKELAAKRSGLQNSRDRVAQLKAALRKYDQEIASLQAQRQEAEDRAREAGSETESCEVRIRELTSELSRLQEERKKADEDAARFGARCAEIARELAARSSRLNTLREMADAHEGFREGVRSVIAASKAGKIGGGFAVVADVISVPEGCELAIETALGGSVQDIITDSVEDAAQAIAFLKAEKAGRATFLPLNGMRPSDARVRGRMDRVSGALGIAADLIDYEARFDPAIRSLLGRAVVVDNMDNALELSKRLSGWDKIVTLEGELIVPSGAITGGAGKGRGPGLLLRKQEIESLIAEISELERTASELARKQRRAQERAADLERAAAESEERLSACRVSLAEQQRNSDLAAAELERSTARLETVRLEKDEAARLRSEESANAKHLQKQLEAVGRENTDLDEKVSGAEHDIEQLADLRAAEREELMRLNIELAGFAERASAIRDTLKEARRSLDELTAALASRHSQIDRISLDVAALLEEQDTIESERARQQELLEAAEARLDELVARRTAELENAARIDGQLREAGAARNRLAEDTHDADVKEARLEVQVSQTSQRLLEGYEVSSDQALDWPEQIDVERGTAAEVARLRREIRAMGTVNTGAIPEYERIKERCDFLTQQRADLERARDQITAAIREIDVNTRGLFMETFDSAAANFDLIFKRLFGGGRAELSLTDPNDLLETGINVTVQPPGKKLQDMALMSGGERALTAAALIFALLMTKPSPFVVLDEVDAPLDESNVERFAEVLKEFAANSQFIVITHNRATMEAADSLYGVTMQEPGISKMLSVKLTAQGPVQDELAPSAELASAST